MNNGFNQSMIAVYCYATTNDRGQHFSNGL